MSKITFKILTFIALSSMLLASCGGGLPGADARKYPPQPEKRVEKNEGGKQKTAKMGIA